MIKQIYIFIYEVYIFLSLIYRLCLFLVDVIDKIVEATMIRTIYRLSNSQKYVMMHIFILVGLGLVKDFNP